VSPRSAYQAAAGTITAAAADHRVPALKPRISRFRLRQNTRVFTRFRLGLSFWPMASSPRRRKCSFAQPPLRPSQPLPMTAGMRRAKRTLFLPSCDAPPWQSGQSVPVLIMPVKRVVGAIRSSKSVPALALGQARGAKHGGTALGGLLKARATLPTAENVHGAARPTVEAASPLSHLLRQDHHARPTGSNRIADPPAIDGDCCDRHMASGFVGTRRRFRPAFYAYR
jgi:hypothetical protein